jgi:hypothetical protein
VDEEHLAHAAFSDLDDRAVAGHSRGRCRGGGSRGPVAEPERLAHGRHDRRDGKAAEGRIGPR